MALLECPMCDFTVRPTDDYMLRLHFEQVHTPDSPFVIKEDPPSLPPRPSSNRKNVPNTTSYDGTNATVLCSEPDCGEVVFLLDLNDHLDYHDAESLSFDETTGKYHSHHSSRKMRHRSSSHRPSHHKSRRSTSTAEHTESNPGIDSPEAKSHEEHGHRRKRRPARERRGTDGNDKATLARSIIDYNPFRKSKRSAKPPNKDGRLGESELGPYAWEDRMPQWLHDQLNIGPKITVVNRVGRDGRLIKQEQVQNETPGIVPILAQLSALDRNVSEAYYCHPSTLHIGKTPKEGSFCGYRNIQMMMSYIQGAKAQGCDDFPGRTPSVLRIQEIIEKAWDKGINDFARVETGGIFGTRKYIGTPEVQALFLSSEIDCAVEVFSDRTTAKGKIHAHEQLFLAVEKYFSEATVNDGSNVHKTLLPPIYLQRPGHSLTIVGFERRRDGHVNLVVLDPQYSTSPAMHKLIGRRNIKSPRPEVMDAYRRGSHDLGKFAAFEILRLTATPPLLPAWDILRQYPDCRFIYVLFRSLTLGYDMYPEDHFLRTFPWQLFGGLWIVDESRFAQAAPPNLQTAQSLRLITGNGSSTSSCGDSPASPFSAGSFGQLPGTNKHMMGVAQSQISSYSHSFESSANNCSGNTQFGNGSAPEVGNSMSTLAQPAATKPHLTLLTDVGRKHPGFLTPLSPTWSARDLYPTPMSDTGSCIINPRVASPSIRAVSPMSIDSPDIYGYSGYPYGGEQYAPRMGLIDSIISPGSHSYGLPNSPQIPPISPQSPMSSEIPTSPRMAMLKYKSGGPSLNQISSKLPTSPRLAALSNPRSQPPSPALSPGPGLQYHPSTVNVPGTFSNRHTHPTNRVSSLSSWGLSSSSASSMKFANGTLTEVSSPISLDGTMLVYTSNRNPVSGLLAVPPLSEPQIAEYRFWVPCGSRTCAFGCGGAHEGEIAASKRLFKETEPVEEQAEVYSECGSESSVPSAGSQGGTLSWSDSAASDKSTSPVIVDWAQFLSNRERVGVAAF